MEQNVITFTGKNEQLFSRHIIDELNPRLTLIVPETHNAILIKDGQMLQTLSSGRYLISQFVDLKLEKESAVEVLFMSKTAKLKLLWGTASKFLMYDATVEDNYKVGMSGDFDVQIGDPRKCYLYLVGADSDGYYRDYNGQFTQIHKNRKRVEPKYKNYIKWVEYEPE